MVTLGTNLPGSGTGRGTGSGDWFAALAASPRPAVVDHAGGGDRVELSGRVLANWGAKTANLVESEGHGPDATVLVDLPLDWTSLAVLLGLARAGVAVVFAGERDGEREDAGRAGQHGQHGPGTPGGAGASAGTAPPEADLIVTASPGDWAEHPADMWAVDMGEPTDAHSAQMPDAGAAAPAHAVDFLTEVRMQADQCHLPLPGGTEGLPGLAAAWADLGTPDQTASDHTASEQADEAQGRLSRRERGVVVAAASARLDRAVASAAADAWDRGLPVVLVPEQAVPFSAETARRVEAEGLGSPA